jgi:hypothetical protein
LLCRLAKRTLFSTAVAIRLEFDGPQFAIEWSIGKMWKRQVVGDVQNIRSVDIMVEEVQVLPSLYLFVAAQYFPQSTIEFHST